MRTVITYGTFDLFHQGHYNILKRAKEAGDYLIVGVTGETYDAERGQLSVQDSLATRIENVQKTGFADKIIVEEYLGQKISDIQKYHVDVFVIGSDWRGKFDHLSKYCEINYLERTKDISSTQLREENLHIYRLGIATDDIYDNDATTETQKVSGIHVESAYAPEEEVAKTVCETNGLYQWYTDYAQFLEGIDIVYVKTALSRRANDIKAALEAGKHVVADVPFSMDINEVETLKDIAQKQGLVLMENVSTIYQHAFGQLVWMARGNLIGDLVSIDCAISKSAFGAQTEADLYELAYYPVCAILKIFGSQYQNVSSKRITIDGKDQIAQIGIEYENAIANAKIGLDLDIPCEMTIHGTKGSIHVPEDWWRMGYFKMKQSGEERAKNYSSNFDGNGFRYLIRALLMEMKSNSDYLNRITMDEAKAVQQVLGMLEG